ncbi:MAG: hypothetical protein J7L76_05360 [Spirochaetaceae bacterium]|nr:hypothetical protein [Spirochaetaceae bacterium]
MTHTFQNENSIVPALTIFVSAIFLSACAGGPGAESQVKSENEIRTYERFKSDTALKNQDDLQKTGIYNDDKFFYVVISLTDSGTDRYPEWACDKLLTSLYGYRAADQRMVSDNEFYELALKFSVDEIIEGKYENLARVKVREKDVESFLMNYKAEN